MSYRFKQIMLFLQALANAKYLQACIKETQRMFPFVSSTSRRYPKDLILSGHRVPAGKMKQN